MSAYGDCDLCHKGQRFLTRCVMCGIEILACDECREVENVKDDDAVEAFMRKARAL